jgi:hypothetical protein
MSSIEIQKISYNTRQDMSRLTVVVDSLKNSIKRSKLKQVL